MLYIIYIFIYTRTRVGPLRAGRHEGSAIYEDVVEYDRVVKPDVAQYEHISRKARWTC